MFLFEFSKLKNSLERGNSFKEKTITNFVLLDEFMIERLWPCILLWEATVN